MRVASKLEDIRALTDQELIKRHDHEAIHTVVGSQYYMDELARREAARATDVIKADTGWVKWLTIAIAVMTAANVVLVAISLHR